MSTAPHPSTSSARSTSARLASRIAFAVLLLLVAAACSGSAPPSSPSPVAVAVAGSAAGKPPCEVAVELRARVPRLMKEGKLHRTGRVIEKANRLCPATARETWAAEVEVATALGRYVEARKLIAAIGAAPDAPEGTKAAAKLAAERVKRFDQEWPPANKVTAEMRNAYDVAEQAAGEGRLEEAIGLYEKAWEAWPPNGHALMSAGFLAKKLERGGETQRLFDRATAVLERRTGTTGRVEVPNGFASAVTAVAWSPNGKRFAVANGSVVSVFDAETWHERARLEGHTDSVSTMAFSPDGRRFASGSHDRTIRLWDPVTGGPLFTLQGHGSHVTTVAFSPDGRRLASGASDKTAQLWDLVGVARLPTLRGHKLAVSSVAFSPDGKLLASGSFDKTVRLWSTATGRFLGVLKGHTKAVRVVAFSPDGKRLASGSSDNTVRLWHRERGAHYVPGLTIRERAGIGGAVVFSPDGNYIAYGSDAAVQVWDATTPPWDTRAGPLLNLNGHTSMVTAVAFSPNGRYIASGSSDRMVLVWDAWTGHLIRTLRPHTRPSWTAAFSLKAEGHLGHGYHVGNGLCVYFDPGQVTATSPDGKHIARALKDNGNIVTLRSASAGDVYVTFDRHLGLVEAVTFSPDGRRVVTGSRDMTMRQWDARTGDPLLTHWHGASVLAVSFSPDGNRIASGAADNTVRLWDAWTNTLIAAFRGHTGSVTSVGFSPDSSHLVSASPDDGFYLWRIPDASLAAILRVASQKDVSYLFTPTGSIDFQGPDACYARSLAVCRIGPYSFPFDVCEERFYTPGLLAKLLANDTSYLEPEFEPAPLSCPPASP